MQFYNQGLYGDCTGLLTKSGGAFPGSSLFEIPKHGIPLSKLVIGKPATAADATNGYMSPATLGSCVKKAKAKGWNGGVMVWPVRPSPSLPLSHMRWLTICMPSPCTVPPRERRLGEVGEGRCLPLNASSSGLWRLSRPRYPLLSPR